LKAYGDLLGTPEARTFSDRVRDVHEWLEERMESLPSLPDGDRPGVIVQDPCHLRHVQGAHMSLRKVLSQYVDVVELNDDGLCCGAGGSYSLLQPELATAARDRKVDLITKASGLSGAELVVSANPGCSMHLAAVGLDVLHPMQVLAEVLEAGIDPEGVRDGQ
jgi:glycolate oxidase iron-sulfur subunit|tara:strand:- start:16467 stop:16955 length:489 start_codon:yes stop_codon:yes gene_type:complete